MLGKGFTCSHDGHIAKSDKHQVPTAWLKHRLKESPTRRNITPFPSTLTGLEMMADLHSNVHGDHYKQTSINDTQRK